METFEIASGTVLGKDHRGSGKNNQDAFRVLKTPDLLVAIVADGCGSSKGSEVGAIIGSHLVAESLKKIVQRFPDLTSAENMLDRVRTDVIAYLRVLALQMGESLSEIVENYFLFTLVGTVITPTQAVFFSLGDGVIIINGEEQVIGPYPGNKPPYLGYGLVENSLEGSSVYTFDVYQTLPTSQLSHFLIGTDGLEYFNNAQTRNVPGKDEPVGTIDQFWLEDRYFQNPDNVRRRLYLINQDKQSVDWQNQQLVRSNGLLRDDTTLVVGRKRKEAESAQDSIPVGEPSPS